jgi:hypothetical protein
LTFTFVVVASLPEHAHLLGFGHGCYSGIVEGTIVNEECYSGPNRKNPGKKDKIDSPLPASYYPLKLTPEMDAKWLAKVKAGIVEYVGNH